MNHNLIKVLDPCDAQKLVSLGFCYFKEQINKQDVFVFPSTPELVAILQSQFDAKNYVADSAICF